MTTSNGDNRSMKPVETQPPTAALIELIGVTKLFGSKLAVDHVDLVVRSGEVFAFLGPNGAGKTTTIKLITGLLRPTQGQVRVAGRNMASESIEARRHIGYVPDQPHLYEKLSARDFLDFTRGIYGIDTDLGRNYQEQLIHTFEMQPWCNDLIETYSHGMKQRLAFAAALLHRPDVLVLDEPMVGLDPKSMRIVKNLMREAAESGTAVLMSTHVLAVAEEVADRVGIIQHGRMVKLGTVGELRAERKEGMSLEDLFLEVTAEAMK